MGSPVKAVAVILACLVCSTVWIEPTKAMDPDPTADFSPGATEFVLRDVFTNGAVSHGSGGTRAALNVGVFPALESEGITYVHFKMVPCGQNLPHTHPRATEILTMISGGPLQAGFVDTKGHPHIYILNPGDVIVFPRGLLHYELNVGSTEAFYISALNSQNPGVLTTAAALLKLPHRAAAGALNQDLTMITKLKSEAFPYDDQLKLDHRAECVPGQNITIDF